MTYREERDALRFERDEIFARLAAIETRDDDETSRQRLVCELDDVARRLTALAPTRLPLLSAVRIATPCPAKWTSMVGTDRVRHCGICDKEVWNLTAFDAEEAETFLAERRTTLPCLVLHRRKDGHFQDDRCEPGDRRLVRAIASAAALGLGAALALLAAQPASVDASPPVPAPVASEPIDDAQFFGTDDGRPRPVAPVALDPCVVGLCVPTGWNALADVMAGVPPDLLARAEPPTGTVAITVAPIDEPVAAGIETAILRRAARLRRVYEHALLEDPSLGGSVTLALQVETTGTLSHIRVAHHDEALEELGRRAVRVVGDIRIRPAPPERIELTITLDFARRTDE